MGKEKTSNTAEFPVHKVKLEENSGQTKLSSRPSVAFDQSKILFGAAFGAILVGVSVANLGINKTVVERSDHGRGPASAAGISSKPMNDQWQAELVRDLARQKPSPISERGRKPSSYDQMFFGDLGGSYNIEFGASEKIKQIEIEKDINNGSLTKFEGEKFIERYRDFFPGFERVERSESSNEFAQQFALYRGQKARAKVEVRLDSEGRLQSLTVQK